MRLKLVLFAIAAVLILGWLIALAFKIAGFLIHLLLIVALVLVVAGFLTVKMRKFRARQN